MQTATDIFEQDNFSEEDEGISLSETLHTLWLRKRLIISVTLFITLIASLVIFQLTPRYTASTQLLIGINSAKVVDIEEVITGGIKGDSAIIGEMEVLKSRDLAQKVIAKLKLDHYEEFNPALKKKTNSYFSFHFRDLVPQEWLAVLGLEKVEVATSEEDKKQAQQTQIINTFLSKLKVSQLKRSQIITLTYQSENPKLAAKIANELAEQYIIGQLQAKFDATKKATDWLNTQLSDLKDKVKLSEQAVVFFRETHDLVNVSKGLALSQQQLSEINSQLIIARAERSEAQAKYNQVAGILKRGRNIDSVSAVLNSPLIQGLRQKESELQRTYSEMLVEYGKKHPRMIQMRAKVQDIQRNIKAEVQKIAVGLKNDLAVARSRENSLAYSLNKVKTESGDNNKDSVQLRALEREADANRTLFETFLSRFKETSSTQGIEQADARVISKAEPPLSASFPKKRLLLIVSCLAGVFFSVVLVFVLEMLNPGIRSPEQIQELLKMPTLGIVPKVDIKNTRVDQYLIEHPQSALSEAINTLRVSLSVLSPDSAVKTLLVTSAVPSEGKSTLSLLIAQQAAQNNQRVILIDTDFRRPTLEKTFGAKHAPGLTDLLSQPGLNINDLLIKDPDTNMMMLTHGQTKFSNPTDLLASKKMQKLLAQLKTHFDLVILDSPPIMAVPDARVLASLVDKVIFTLAWDSTPKKVAKTALQQLQQDNQHNIAGIVLQQVDLKQYGKYGDSGYYYHYSRYAQYYSHS